MRTLSALFLSFAAAALASAPALPVLPAPSKAMPGDGVLAIDSNFSIGIRGHSDRRLTSAARRLLTRISRQTGIPIRDTLAGPSEHPSLLIECQAAGPAYPTLDQDESYRLEVSSGGAQLSAATDAGALHGLETFVQMIVPAQDGFSAEAFTIEDKPRFPWRGLMLDVSRHWMPVAVVERIWTEWPP